MFVLSKDMWDHITSSSVMLKTTHMWITCSSDTVTRTWDLVTLSSVMTWRQNCVVLVFKNRVFSILLR